MTTILNESDLRRMVPAAYATSPSERASERYAFIPTNQLIDQIEERGWLPTRVHQSKKTTDLEHYIHKIVFRNPSQLEVSVGGVILEITLINSHNLSRRFSLFAGWFRL